MIVTAIGLENGNCQSARDPRIQYFRLIFIQRIFFFFFQNEAMTGTHTQNPVYSRITLALMEDTGWYSANYSMAQELGWGRHLGCDFAMKSCKEWISSKSSRLS